MDRQLQENITRFLNDPTNLQVYDILFTYFTKNHGEKDVYMLAARAMSADLLPHAWKELEKYRLTIDKKEENNPTPHV